MCFQYHISGLVYFCFDQVQELANEVFGELEKLMQRVERILCPEIPIKALAISQDWVQRALSEGCALLGSCIVFINAHPVPSQSQPRQVLYGWKIFWYLRSGALCQSAQGPSGPELSSCHNQTMIHCEGLNDDLSFFFAAKRGNRISTNARCS